MKDFGLFSYSFNWTLAAVLTVVSAALTRGMIWLSIMDMPGGRKVHARPTPKSGGVGVIGACVLAGLMFPPMRENWVLVGLASAYLLGLVGLLDDVHNLSALTKLFAQVLATLLVVGTAPVGVEGKLLASLWLIGITNIFNFMDGLDALAGLVGLLAAATITLAAPTGGATQYMALALAAGLAGFLPFNIPPARIFLGDTGSQFCGFLLGLLGLHLAMDEGVARGGWLLPMLLFGMIFDGLLTLVRRAWSGAPITSAHREHIYQRMPLRAWQVSLVHAGFVTIGGAAWFLAPRVGQSAALLMVIGPQLPWLALARRPAKVVQA